MRSKTGLSIRNSTSSVSPLALRRSVPSAASSPPHRAAARPRAAACGPGRSRRDTGGSTASPKTSGRSLSRHRLEQRQFVRRRSAFRLQRREFEEARRAVIEAEEQVLVRPFEIEGEVQRLAHADVLELVAPQIEEEALRARWRFVRQYLLHHAAVLQRGKVIGRRPVARGVFLAQVEDAGLQRLEARRALAEILEAHLVEVEAARGSPAGPWPSSRRAAHRPHIRRA